MVRLFIVIRRKGSKRFLGAIPTRKGATIASLRRVMPKQIKRGFTFRIVTEKQLKMIILKQRPRTIRRVRRKGRRPRRIKRRRVRRRKIRRRVRRIGHRRRDRRTGHRRRVRRIRRRKRR
ncbi:hypothetical protein LCGC14_0515120 [marine sediment metagenome]|uniref:Uncharacterized protein n=1 Tax=marine sediment metagenome TaxID=412755 RepID=A0A0F9ULN3_9ZZZZ